MDDTQVEEKHTPAEGDAGELCNITDHTNQIPATQTSSKREKYIHHQWTCERTEAKPEKPGKPRRRPKSVASPNQG
jgi:hypothetical protein